MLQFFFSLYTCSLSPSAFFIFATLWWINIYILPKSGRGLGLPWGSTVGYPSDSLGSCSGLLLLLSVAAVSVKKVVYKIEADLCFQREKMKWRRPPNYLEAVYNTLRPTTNPEPYNIAPWPNLPSQSYSLRVASVRFFHTILALCPVQKWGYSMGSKFVRFYFFAAII